MSSQPPASGSAPDGEPGKGERDGRGSLLRDLLEVVALAAIIYLIIAFAVQPVHVEGTSMYPGLHNNDLLITEKVSLYFSGPSEGQIVVVNPPIASSNDFIKRVIALPGEWVRIAPDRAGLGHVYISKTRPTGPGGGTELHEPYINGVWTQEVLCCTAAGTASPALPTTGRWARVPAGYYFVLGDNRNVSEDSRTFGWEPRPGIQAVALFRFWPLTRMGAIPIQMPTLALIGGLAIPAGGLRLRGRSRRIRRAPS